VEAEAAVVNKREVATVIRVFRRRHPRSVPRTAHVEPARERRSGRQDIKTSGHAAWRLLGGMFGVQLDALGLRLP
jgi:hypothetical protein